MACFWEKGLRKFEMIIKKKIVQAMRIAATCREAMADIFFVLSCWFLVN